MNCESDSEFYCIIDVKRISALIDLVEHMREGWYLHTPVFKPSYSLTASESQHDYLHVLEQVSRSTGQRSRCLTITRLLRIRRLTFLLRLCGRRFEALFKVRDDVVYVFCSNRDSDQVLNEREERLVSLYVQIE